MALLEYLRGCIEGPIAAENLANELFFHAPNDTDYDIVTTALKRGYPLLGLMGRDLISRGSIIFHGRPSLIFRIPLSEQ